MSQLLLPRALSVKHIAVALYKHMSRTEHVGRLADLLRIFDGLIEGNAEVMRTKNCKVGILGFVILVGMSVYNGEIVVISFPDLQSRRGSDRRYAPYF